MVDFDAQPAVIGEQWRRDLVKPSRSGMWAYTLLATTRSAGPCSVTNPAASLLIQERGLGRTPRSRAAAPTFTEGSMPRHGMPLATACCSRYPSLLATSTTNESGPGRTFGGVVDKRLRVADPTVGIRGEVGVLREGVLRRDQCRDLQQQAVLTHAKVQRIRRLRRVEFVGGEELLARRCGAQVHNAHQANRITQSAPHLLYPYRRQYWRAAQYAPRRSSTARIVLAMIRTSPTIDQLSTYERSRRTAFSHGRSDRPLTCHRPVTPGFTSSLRCTSSSYASTSRLRAAADRRHSSPAAAR